MIIFGTCVSENGERYRTIALPFIQRAALPEDLILQLRGDAGISFVYNRFISEARSQPECEALVLLHDDVELIDVNFRSKVLALVRDQTVGVVGVVGGSDLQTLAWWNARSVSGRVFETRSAIDHGNPRADVDAVDGLMMIVAPAAFNAFAFDEMTCPQFHGYDVDFCLQARDRGLRVCVAPIDVFHRTRVGHGDRMGFETASSALAKKWPTRFRRPTRREAARKFFHKCVTWNRRIARRARRSWSTIRRNIRWSGARSPVHPHGAQPMSSESPLEHLTTTAHELLCPCCGTEQLCGGQTSSLVTSILDCPNCGTGATWPPPSREVQNDGLWKEMYGDSRLERRSIWFREATKRVDWMQLYTGHGCVLEVGCGTGEFLKVASDEGYDVYGVEVSGWAADQARKLGVEVETGILTDWAGHYPGLHPDIIALWHVLEHVPDPSKLLREIAAMLQPNGYLFLEVPNYASIEARRLGIEWEGAQPKDHFYQFTPRGLEMLLVKTGFEPDIVLPMTSRIYADGRSWRAARNRALLELREWPPMDLLRVVAHVSRQVNGSPG